MLHVGPQAVVISLSLQYSIVHGLRQLIFILKLVLHVIVSMLKQQNRQWWPAERVTEIRLFLRVRIDFGGPTLVKQSQLRGSTSSKCYIALFESLVTKAIYLELVSSLSTDAFLNTIRIPRKLHTN